MNPISLNGPAVALLCVGGCMDGKYVYAAPSTRFFRKAAGVAHCRNRVDSYRKRWVNGGTAAGWRFILDQ